MPVVSRGLLYDSPVPGNCYKVRLLPAHLAEGSSYLPEGPYERALVLQSLFFEQYGHEPYIAVVRFWVAFAPEPPGEGEIAARRRGAFDPSHYPALLAWLERVRTQPGHAPIDA